MFTDLGEHLPYLRDLASAAPVVVELGFRTGISTENFLTVPDVVVHSWDIEPCGEEARKIAAREGHRFTFHQQDSRDADPFPHDLLFIDSEHTAACASAELALWSPHTRRFIAMHDTESYGKVGEKGGLGLLYAVDRFLQAHHEWRLKHIFTNCNGLTVLERA